MSLISTRKRVALILLSITLLMAPMSALSFATESGEGAGTDITALRAAVALAETALNDAKAEEAGAKSTLDAANVAWEEKLTAATEKQAALEQATLAAGDAEQAVTASIAAAQKTAREAYNNADAAHAAAVADSEAARADVAAKQTAKENAQATKDALTTELSGMRSELARLQAQQGDADAILAPYKAAVKEAESRWAQEKQDAADAVITARENYDNAGRNFINEKVTAVGGTNLDTLIANTKQRTNINLQRVTQDSQGNTLTTLADVANHAGFESLINQACSYDNLKQAIAYIREGNALRTSSLHNAGELKVSYQLMATAIVSGTISVYSTGHNLTKAGWGPWRSGNSTTSSENLAYSSASPARGWDPYHGWYHEERMVWLAKQKDTQVTEAIANQVIAESATAPNPYTIPNLFNRNMAELLADVNSSSVTGHYESLVNNSFKATGVAYVNGTGFGLKNGGTYSFPHVAAQEFNSDTSTSITVDQFEQQLEAYFATYRQALTNAQAAQAALESAPAYVVSARNALTQKESELNSQEAAITQLQGQIAQKESELAAAENNLTNATNAYNTAVAVATEKETAVATALSEKERAKAAADRAEAITITNPISYEDYPAIVAAAQEKATADRNLAAARLQSEAAASALSGAEAAREAALADYNAKKAVTAEKQAAYDRAVQALAEVEDIRTATIAGIADKTYTGSAITQNFTVMMGSGDNVVPLEAGEDYDVKYEENINAGTASVTITGKGNYTGTKTVSFKINPKKITPTVTLSTSVYTYNGKAKKPGVTVKYGKIKLLPTKQYEVTYASGRKSVGKYAVKITLTGNYTGTKTVYFEINPKRPTIKTPAAAKKAVTVKWSKMTTKMSTSRISGYQVQVATNSKFTKNKKTVNVAGYTKTSKKISGLKAKTKYYVKVRTYKKVGSKTYYSPWSSVRTVKTK